MNLTDLRTSAYKFILLKSVNVTNPCLRQPAVIPERKKYCIHPRRSPRTHCQTAVFDQIRQSDGVLWPGRTWDHSHLDARYKRAPSGYLVQEATFIASTDIVTRDSSAGETSASHLTFDKDLSTVNNDSSTWNMPSDEDSRDAGDDSSAGVNPSLEWDTVSRTLSPWPNHPRRRAWAHPLPRVS
jgi:hypothetical protein